MADEIEVLSYARPGAIDELSLDSKLSITVTDSEVVITKSPSGVLSVLPVLFVLLVLSCASLLSALGAYFGPPERIDAGAEIWITAWIGLQIVLLLTCFAFAIHVYRKAVRPMIICAGLAGIRFQHAAGMEFVGIAQIIAIRVSKLPKLFRLGSPTGSLRLLVHPFGGAITLLSNWDLLELRFVARKLSAALGEQIGVTEGRN